MSIGLACAVPSHGRGPSVPDLYRLADGALYEAKAGGRNQTRCAAPQGVPATPPRGTLQLVSAS